MIVSVFGHINHGKSTFAKMLRQHLEFPSMRFKELHLWDIKSFAAPGKQFVCDVMGVDIDFLNQWKNIPEPPPGWSKNVRTVLQEAISYWRTVKPGIWTEKATAKARHVIFDDGRFENEFAASGVRVFIHDPRKVCTSDHESEALARKYIKSGYTSHKFDFLIRNDDTLDRLNYAASQVALCILKGMEDAKAK